MDSSFVVKPRAGAYAPRDPVPVRGAVATDLSLAKTTTATGDGTGQQSGHGRNGDHGRHDEPRPDHGAPEVVVDPENRDMIYRERDVRAPDREHPDQALQRQRAYRPAIASAPDEFAPDGAGVLPPAISRIL